MLFKDLLNKEMTNHRLTVQDMVDITGLSYNKIYSYTKGTIPKNDDLRIVCEAIGVDVDDIVFEDLNISVTECARMLGKSTGYVKAMVKNGVFGCCVGNNFHIPRLQVEKYMGIRDSPDINELVGLLGYAIKDIITDQIKKADLQSKSTNQKTN